MKKSKKLLIALLSATCLTAGAFGLAACGNANDSALYNVYTEYVASAGDNAMTYEEWLKSTLNNVGKPGNQGEPGEPGEPGKPGADGKSAYDLYKESLPATETPDSLEVWLKSLYGAQGEPGADGISITGVKLSTDGKKLVFSFTKGADVELPLPESFTHVHDYNNAEVAVVIEPTVFKEGLGYIQCQVDGCEHLELVTVPLYSYMVTVVDYAGKPIKGAKVTLNGETVTSNENGEAIFEELAKGAYDIVVSARGYDSLETGKTNATKPDYTVTMYPVVNDYIDLDHKVGETATYLVSVEYEEWWAGYGNWNTSEVSLVNESNEGALYTVTPNGEYGAISVGDGMGHLDGETFEVYVPAGESVSISCGVDYGVEGDAYKYTFTIEKLTTPTKKGTRWLPITVKADTQITATDEEVYYVFEGFAGTYTFNFGSNVSVTKLGTDLFNPDEQTVTANTTPFAVSEYYSSYFKVSADDGNISFTVVSNFAEGAKANPYTLTLGDKVQVAGGLYGDAVKWYKFEVSDDGKYVAEAEATKGEPSFTIYSKIGYSSSDNELLTRVSSAFSIYDLEAGTYYIECKYAGELTVRAYDATADIGKDKSIAEEISAAQQYTVTDMHYYIYTAAADGKLWFSAENAKFTVYNNENFSGTKFNQNSNITSMTVAEGDKVYFTAMADNNEVSASVTLTMVDNPETKVDYTIVVKNAEKAVLAGQKVSLKLDGEFVKNPENADENWTLTTNEQGEVKFSLTPGVYEVFVEDSDDYICVGSVTAKEAFAANSTTVTLHKLYDFEVTVKLNGVDLLPGVEVEVHGNFYGANLSETAITDENGVAKVKLPLDLRSNVTQYYLRILTEGYKGDTTYNTIQGTKPTEGTVAGTVDYSAKEVYIQSPVTMENGKAEFTAAAKTEYTLTFDTSKKMTVKVENGSLTSFIIGAAEIVSNGQLTDNGYIGWFGVSLSDNVLTIDPSQSTNSMMLQFVSNSFVFVFETDAKVTIEYVS